MRCPECGLANPEGTQFCRCGYMLKQLLVVPTLSPKTVNDRNMDSDSIHIRRNKMRKILYLLIGLLLFSGVIGLALLFRGVGEVPPAMVVVQAENEFGIRTRARTEALKLALISLNLHESLQTIISIGIFHILAGSMMLFIFFARYIKKIGQDISENIAYGRSSGLLLILGIISTMLGISLTFVPYKENFLGYQERLNHLDTLQNVISIQEALEIAALTDKDKVYPINTMVMKPSDLNRYGVTLKDDEFQKFSYKRMGGLLYQIDIVTKYDHEYCIMGYHRQAHLTLPTLLAGIKCPDRE